MRVTLMLFVTLLQAHMASAADGPTVIGGKTKEPEVAQVSTPDEPPQFKKVVKPKYPKAARDQKIEGVVVVEFLIDEAGRVQAPRVVESVSALDEAAVECVSKWRFKPGRRNGKPVSTVVRAPVEFNIDWGRGLRGATVLGSVQVQIPAPRQPSPELEARLASEDPAERARAAWQLAGVRPARTALLERLRELSRVDSNQQVRQAAAWAYYHVEAASGITGPTRAYDEPPAAVRTPRPSPPSDPAARRMSGDVVVDVLISESGEVAHAEVSQSVMGLDDSALECAKAWLFTPARAEGRPVPCVARVSVSFRAYK